LGSPDDIFVSLGFGGEITLLLPGYVTGDNVTAVEVTFGRDGYPDEKASVYVSENGVDWEYAGMAYNKDTDGKSIIDVSWLGLSGIEYVKLVDISDISLFGDKPNADGYDLDAVGAVVCLDELE